MLTFPSLGPNNNIFFDIISSFKGFIMENMIGNKYGKWTIISYEGKDKKSNNIYLCCCECGFLKKQRIDILKNGESTQCKKCFLFDLNKTDNLIGKQFGLWNVKDKVKNELRNEWFYLCECKCGFQRNIAGNSLKSKRTTKCHRCRVKTHGMSNTDTFRIWTGILRRCNNPNFKAYPRYGGRGIKVCDRWLSFDNFYNDMGARPQKLQIDRIDNDGNYEPANCRWVTPKVNSSNRNVLNNKKGK